MSAEFIMQDLKTVSWYCCISRHAVVILSGIISISKYDEIYTVSKSVLNLIWKTNEVE